MQTILSHIIRKRYSQAGENVAAFVLESSPAARNGFMKLLRGIDPSMPELRFSTQQSVNRMRPDMWGFFENKPRVFVENKFWAGLTDNQPIAYLKQLSIHMQAGCQSVLLFIAPAARELMLMRELKSRLASGALSFTEGSPIPGVSFCANTDLGPILALTSWNTVISLLEHETIHEPGTRGDLLQLQSLCEAADIDAFIPFSATLTSDQRIPAMMLQLGSVIRDAVDRAIEMGVLSVDRLRPQSSWDRIGRYIRMSGSGDSCPGGWTGLHFPLWKAYGSTPLWLVFSDGEFSRREEVAALIEPWAAQHGILAVSYENDFAVALDVPAGEEKSMVVRAVADRLKTIFVELRPLCAKHPPNAGLSNKNADRKGADA